MNPSLLIEIGTEELPVEALDSLYAYAREAARNLLKKNRFDFKTIHFEATPRRIVFFVEEISPRQREEKNLLIGPAAEKAYDGEGKPTPALEGFLRVQKADLDEIKIHENARGKYVAIEKIQKGEPAAKLLTRLIPELLVSVPFRKTMRWEPSGFRFPRPIRWVVALLGKSVLPVKLGGVKARRLSRGHRFLSKSEFSIPKADWQDYQKRLLKQNVLLSLEERKRTIQKTLEGKFRQREVDADLVHQTAQLVESPYLIEGKFSGSYRDLPEEVLATCMKKHQKIFACRDEKGNLKQRFVSVLNGRRSNLAGIRRDYENVLDSRLRDAQYFYDEDTREPLEKRVPRLKELVFIGKLGTVTERTERLGKLAKELSAGTGHSDWQRDLERVALLAKADLVTHLVGEFPELQGVIGGKYALECGEAPAVAQAIGEQYLPKNLNEEAPRLSKKISPLGALFGIVDRIDLLVGAFGVRLDPTGSEDPYALRRAGGSLVKLVHAFGFSFSLSDLIRKSHSLYGNKLEVSEKELSPKLLDFLKTRMAFELQLKPGSRPYEILQGVVKADFDDLAGVFERFEVLSRLSEKQPQVFFQTSKVVERTGNILKGAKEKLDSVDPALLQDPLEKELFEILKKSEPALAALSEKKDYEELTRSYGETFFEPLHRFFDHVMVNVEDAPVRRNRQALMKKINALFAVPVADLTLLTQVKESQK